MVGVRADRIPHYFLDQQGWSPAVTSAAVLCSDSCKVNAVLLGLKELLVAYPPCLQEGRRCQLKKCTGIGAVLEFHSQCLGDAAALRETWQLQPRCGLGPFTLDNQLDGPKM